MTYRLNGTLSHAVTTKSKIMVDLATERYKDYQLSTVTDRYLAGVRFEHLAAEMLTWALDYRYTKVFSPEVSMADYYNNRFTVEVRKGF
jgi:hypothetical protein